MSGRARPPEGGAGAAVTRDDLAGPDLHRVLAGLRRRAPVAWVPAIGAWLVTDRASVLAALRDPGTFTVDDPRFTTARILGPSMLSRDGAEHRRHRDPFLAPFRPSAVDRRDRPLARGRADELVSTIRPGGRAELRAAVAGPLAVTVIARAIGLDPSTDASIGVWYRDIVAGVEALTSGTPLPRATREAVDGLRVAVEAAGADPTSPVARIAAEATLSAEELVADLGVVLFGAVETSEGATANALLHLLSDPVLTARAAADPDLLEPIVEESLRLEPAAAVVDRYVTTAVRFGPPGAEVELSAGDPVVLSLAAANRDPAAHPDPDRFDPDRFGPDRFGGGRGTDGGAGARQLAFAAGPHACLGAHLARVETIAALRAVLELLPGIALDRGASTPPTGLVFRKPVAVVADWPT